MDAELLRAFRNGNATRLAGARIRTVRCGSGGLTLGLQSDVGPLELGLYGLRGVAWAVIVSPGDRAMLLAHLPGASDAALPDWPEATRLDALRAWLLRPLARSPEWLQLEGDLLRDIEVDDGDRVLRLALARPDRIGKEVRLELHAEIFDRGLNFLLRDAAGVVIANWSGRAPAPRREAKTPAATPTHVEPAALLVQAYTALAAASARDLVAAAEREVRQRRKRLQHLVRALDEDRQRAAQSASWRRQAELLSANLHRVKRGQRQIQVENLFAGNAPLDIELDPRLTPQENVALLYKRARRGERGLPGIETRLQRARLELGTLGDIAPASTWPEALARCAGTFARAVPKGLLVSPASLWSAGGPAVRPWPAAERLDGPPMDTSPGRRFELPGGWEVRVGRSNAENDELTHRFAKPDDVWLHASGVPGSHVVLRMRGRKENPPRQVLEAAASIAARFSKAKHAGTVPVIWTRKRFVRKPRGGKPGLALCTHEKTLFVKPGLPETAPE